MTSTPGAIHCADVNGTFAGSEYAPKPDQPKMHYDGAPLYELAAAHVNQPPLTWLANFYNNFRAQGSPSETQD